MKAAELAAQVAAAMVMFTAVTTYRAARYGATEASRAIFQRLHRGAAQ